MLADGVTGIAPRHAPGFIAGQLLGGLAAIGLVRWLYGPRPSEAAEVVVPVRDARTPDPLP